MCCLKTRNQRNNRNVLLRGGFVHLHQDHTAVITEEVDTIKDKHCFICSGGLRSAVGPVLAGLLCSRPGGYKSRLRADEEQKPSLRHWRMKWNICELWRRWWEARHLQPNTNKTHPSVINDTEAVHIETSLTLHSSVLLETCGRIKCSRRVFIET